MVGGILRMPILRSKDGKHCILTCKCSCDEGIHFKVDKDDDFDYYCFMSYINGQFHRDQSDKIRHVLCKKLKKIISIIRNKDYYYSEVILTKEDFNEFREYINSIK